MQQLTLLSALLILLGSAHVAANENPLENLKKSKIPKHHSLSLNKKLVKIQLDIEAQKEALRLQTEQEARKLFEELINEFKKLFKKSDLRFLSDPLEENLGHLVTFDSLCYLPLFKSKQTLKANLQGWLKNFIALTNEFYNTELLDTWPLLSEEAQKDLIESMEEIKNKKRPFLSLKDLFSVLVDTTSLDSDIAQQIIDFIHRCCTNINQDEENYNFGSSDKDTSLVTTRLVHALLQNYENFDLSNVEKLIALPQLFLNLFNHQNAILTLLDRKAPKSFTLSYNPEIKTLNLSGNQVNLSKFVIPTVFENISNLNLSHCNLDKLPDDFLTFFPELNDLNISNNNLKILCKISKESDHVTKKIKPKKINLRNLDASNNKFKNIPQILTKADITWPYLTTVNFQNNKISTVNEVLFNHSSLLDLDLSNNPIETIKIDENKRPFKRKKLYSINLSNTELTGKELFNIFWSIYSIETLNLKNLEHKYADVLFEKFVEYYKQHNVKIAFIKWGKFTHICSPKNNQAGTGCDEDCTKGLDQAWPKYEGKLTKYIRVMKFSEDDSFSKTYNLKQFSGHHFPFKNDTLFNKLFKSSSLKTLTIQDVPLESTQLKIITTQLRLLTDLTLKNCNLTNDTLNKTSLKLLKYLTTIDFSNNALKETVRIKIPKKLLYLILEGNEIENLNIQIYKKITKRNSLAPITLNSSELRTIDLSNNHISTLDDAAQLLEGKRFYSLRKIDMTNNFLKKRDLKKLQESNSNFVLICDDENKDQLLLSDNGYFFRSDAIEKIKLNSDLPVIVAKNQRKKKQNKKVIKDDQSNHSSKNSSVIEENR